MEKSQNTPLLAVGMNGKRGFGGYRLILDFSFLHFSKVRAGSRLWACKGDLASMIDETTEKAFPGKKRSFLHSSIFQHNHRKNDSYLVISFSNMHV